MPTQNMTPNYLPPLHNGLARRAPILESKSASFTMVASDSGKKFLILGATATVTITLPAISEGPFEMEVFIGSDQTVEVQSVVADTIITYNDLAADKVGFATSGEKIGGGFYILCDGTKLFVLPRLASIYQTTTITT